MHAFTCNICGAHNEVENFASEPATCACGSNVRLRALVYLLSVELFGRVLIARDFPKLKAVRGLGMSDQACYAEILADKFDYTNTYYDREPRFDFTEPHPELSGTYDFILSADVLEHIAPPVENAVGQVHRLLRPNGFFLLTVYCNPSDNLREHFPDLHDYRVIHLGPSDVLVNRRQDGTLQVTGDLIFHGGSGATLEMREFGITALKHTLQLGGFREVDFLTSDIPEVGILLDHDTSQPAIGRKDPFVLNRCAQHQMVNAWFAAQVEAGKESERAAILARQIDLACRSRWLRLGRKLGAGPAFVKSPGGT